MKTKSEILKKLIHESKFLSCLSNEVGKLTIMKAMDEHAKGMACGFAEWLTDNFYTVDSNFYWYDVRKETHEIVLFKTAELYHKFELEQAQIAQK